MNKIVVAENWDGTEVLVKMKDLHEWTVWDRYNRKHRIHPKQSEFTEAEFLPKHLHRLS